MNDVEKLHKLQEQTGYSLLQVNTLRCKAHLPAATWRALAKAERPDVYGDVAIVAVEDGGETVVAIPTRHWNTIIDRIRELEAWAAELVVAEETA